MSEVLDRTKDRMDAAAQSLTVNFSKVRTGRANASALDGIEIDYYGAPTPIAQLGGIKVAEGHMLVVEPWDKSVLSAIERAIQASDLGVTPQNDGAVIRLPFPAPTEERRRELVKECHELAEEARIAVRNVRRDANSTLDKMKKDGELSEDDLHREQAQVQKLTDAAIKKIDELLKAKEAEVMKV